MFSRKKPKQSSTTPTFAAMLQEFRESRQWAIVPREKLPDTLIAACIHCGTTLDGRFIEGTRALYSYVADVCLPNVRTMVLGEVGDAVYRGETSESALLPILFCDPEREIIAAAAMEIAQVTPQDGPGFVLSLAKQESDPVRASAIVQGIYLLGDARLRPLLDEAWATVLSEEGKTLVLGSRADSTKRATVDFVVDLIEALDDNDPVFGAAMAALVRLARNAMGGVVIETLRSFPIQQGAPPLVEVERWSIAEYGQIIAPRLHAVWECEAEPKITQVAAAAWGITF